MDQIGFPLRFILVVLAVWRVTHLLASEDGPADAIVKFRALLGNSLVGRMMDCFNCLSLWIAAPAALLLTRQFVDWVLVWLALSGASCLLERFGHEHIGLEPASQLSEGDAYHVLRSETSGVAEQFGDPHDAHREPGDS
jgi:hypothetical protein